MSTDQLLTLGIACLVSVACVLPGVFLVLRGVALMSDAISHAILLGIVTSFFLVGNLHSPFLIIGATLSGLVTVFLTEWVIHTRRLKEDAAIGLIFPIFFSIGVILISKYAGHIHLDTDAVLLGELAFAPFNRLELGGYDLGPISLWTMGIITGINALFVWLWYKELKITTFDPALAKALGFSPLLMHYLLMGVTSITCVGAFDVVGSILVVSLMITPPATAYLLTESLSGIIGLSIGFGIISSLVGYGVAYYLDASIAGAIASVSGVFFVIALFLSPQQGILLKYFRRKRQQTDFYIKMLLVQLLSHEGTDLEEEENTIDNMIQHMGWEPMLVRRIVRVALDRHVVSKNDSLLLLTPLGREMAKSAMQMT